MKSKGNTSDNRDKRLDLLSDILDEAEREQKKLSTKEILHELSKKKFNISPRTLYDDYAELSKNDSFVQDIASKTYSKYIRNCFESIEFAEQQARIILNQEWTRSKTVKKQIPTKDGDIIDIEEETTTEPLAEPKLKAIQEIRECAVAKVKLLGGDLIKVSAKAWSIQREKDIETISKLKSQVQELTNNKN